MGHQGQTFYVLPDYKSRWSVSTSQGVWVLSEAALHRPATETHELAERKLKELERLREAWGIQEDAVEGAAFDQDLQVNIASICCVRMVSHDRSH